MIAVELSRRVGPAHLDLHHHKQVKTDHAILAAGQEKPTSTQGSAGQMDQSALPKLHLSNFYVLKQSFQTVEVQLRSSTKTIHKHLKDGKYKET